jgi:flavin-binding protein dodecin
MTCDDDPPPVNCDDKNPDTVDTCDPKEGCINTPLVEAWSSISWEDATRTAVEGGLVPGDYVEVVGQDVRVVEDKVVAADGVEFGVLLKEYSPADIAHGWSAESWDLATALAIREGQVEVVKQDVHVKEGKVAAYRVWLDPSLSEKWNGYSRISWEDATMNAVAEHPAGADYYEVVKQAAASVEGGKDVEYRVYIE